MMSPTHPSFLELDRLALDAAKPATREHVATCTECQAHLSRLEHPVPVPRWVRGGRPVPQPPPFPRLWAFAAAVICASLVAGVTVTVTRSASPAYVEKATAPAVALFIKREERVTQWDTREAV